MNYQEFIAGKFAAAMPTGFDGPFDLPESLFPMQHDLVSWSLKRGRAAIFADTGLGKSRMQVSWAAKVHELTGLSVMILAPLAVAQQTIAEGAEIGVTITRCREPGDVQPGLNITNYDRIHKFDCSQFGAVVLDESSCIKHHTAKTLQTLMDSFGHCLYKLCATATPAPNDWTELGTHAEFLGICSRAEMLAEFFVHDGGETQTWRLKGHARHLFWQWVASWGAMIRKPSDLGYDDAMYELPPLTVVDHVVDTDEDKIADNGMLFALEASSMTERREARKASMANRIDECVNTIKICAKLAEHKQDGDSHGMETRVCRNSQKEGSGRSGIQGKEEQPVLLGQGCEKSLHEGLLCEQSRDVAEKGQATVRRKECSKTFKVCTELGTQGKDEATVYGMVEGESGQGKTCSTNECIRYEPGSIQCDAGIAGEFVRDMRVLGHEQSEGFPACGSLPLDGEGSRDSLLELQHGAWKVQRRHESPIFGNIIPSQPWLIWCEYNDEQDMLENLLGNLAYSVRGSMTPDEKEFALFSWVKGDRPFLISKPSIAGWGLNFQHCSNMAFVGVSDSFEAYYQAVRRCYRFGQKKEVTVHRFASQLESAVMKNLERKQTISIEMGESLAMETRAAVTAQIKGATRATNDYNAIQKVKAPAWLVSEE